ncbi:MAG: DEAD/DEAH box helicase [Candidatus Omnitrophica bacterium]|nr:DEAD/DEAH box helicase [Candidatus Omnitrophota bacterium]MCB9767156.1 DEAD/DEAH box helicase [Candidatus Omnitrophota bacterium]
MSTETDSEQTRSTEEIQEAKPLIEVLHPENPLPPVEVEDLPRALQNSIKAMGWEKLAPVQSLAIPYLLAERDMMVQSRTGSGKTGAFVLPLLEKLDPEKNYCQALILVPTRELAQQVTHEVENLGRDTGVRSVSVYGGVGYKNQLNAFKEGAHIVVGTAGRILDHLIRGSLDLRKIHYLIFDEADRMMSMGSYPDMREIASYLPKNRTSFMFSATYPSSVRRLAGQFLRNPGFLSLSHNDQTGFDTEHVFIEVPGMDKDRALIRIIELENPESAIIFCNTKAKVEYLSTVLKRFGYDADPITSDLTQKARDRVLDRLRRHGLRFLVATDVAARGIDISNLSHVFNFEIPDDPESYVHRTGRTGRAGASGIAITLAAPTEKPALKTIAKRFDVDLAERKLPTEEDVQKIASERLTGFLEAKLRKLNRIERERLERLKPLAKALSESEDEVSLLAMVMDEYYQKALHAPPVVPEEKIEQQGNQGSESGDGGNSGKRKRRRRSRG